MLREFLVNDFRSRWWIDLCDNNGNPVIRKYFIGHDYDMFNLWKSLDRNLNGRWKKSKEKYQIKVFLETTDGEVIWVSQGYPQECAARQEDALDGWTEYAEEFIRSFWVY